MQFWLIISNSNILKPFAWMRPLSLINCIYLEQRKAAKVMMAFSLGCVLQTSLARRMSGTPPRAPTAEQMAFILVFSFSKRMSKSRGRPSHASIDENPVDMVGSERR